MVFIGVILIIVLIGGTILWLYSLYKNNKNKSENINQSNKKIKKDNQTSYKNLNMDNPLIASFQKNFSKLPDKKIEIFNLNEEFNLFPFSSSFMDAKNKFEKNIVKTLLIVQEQYIKIFERYIKKYFEAQLTMTLKYNTEVQKECFKYYKMLVENGFNIFKELFIKKDIISITLYNDSFKLSSIEENLKEYSLRIDKILVEIIIELEKECNLKYENYYNENNYYNDFEETYSDDNDFQTNAISKLEQAYLVLGVKESSTNTQIKICYKNLAKIYHPDINKIDKTKIIELNNAYDFICNKRNIK